MKKTNMKRQEILSKAKSILKEIYLEYKDKGVVSIYIWGSILTSDFNPKKSDIDTVAIVKDNFNIDFVEEINKKLSEEKSGLHGLKLNNIFLGEFNGGKIRSKLAKVIHPHLLLLDFNNWKFVCGKKFMRKDFLIKGWSEKEALKHRINEFYGEDLPRVEKEDYSGIKYLCKNLLRVCHHLNQLNGKKSVFNYDTLMKNSNKKDKRLVELLLKIRKSDWDENLFRENLVKLKELVSELK